MKKQGNMMNAQMIRVSKNSYDLKTLKKDGRT